MGLDVYVAGFGNVRLGSYGWYHSFRLAICDYLEDGCWGAKFPLLQNHSDCVGRLKNKKTLPHYLQGLFSVSLEA